MMVHHATVNMATGNSRNMQVLDFHILSKETFAYLMKKD